MSECEVVALFGFICEENVPNLSTFTLHKVSLPDPLASPSIPLLLTKKPTEEKHENC
jgi:hypothetical protein